MSMGSQEGNGKLELKLVQGVAGRSDVPDRHIMHEKDRPDFNLPVASDVPIIDLRRLLGNDEDEAKKFSYALRSWGIFHLIGHDVPLSLLDDMRDVARKFFQLPLEAKQKYSNLQEGGFQYDGYGNDFVARENQIIDWNDRLYLQVLPEDARKLKYWPEDPSSFRDILHEFTAESRKITELLLLCVAQSLGLDETYFVSRMDKTAQVNARFNYFPPCSRPDLVVGLKAHSDSTTLTVVLPDKEVEGLQVLKDGDWMRVPIIPDSLLVNMGNLMEIMSNGIVKSPVHRVVAGSSERISLVMFNSLPLDMMLEPAEGLVDEARPSLYRKMKTLDFLKAIFEKLPDALTTIEWLRVSPGTQA